GCFAVASPASTDGPHEHSSAARSPFAFTGTVLTHVPFGLYRGGTQEERTMSQVAKLAITAIAALAIAGDIRAQDSTTTAPSVMDATAEVKAKSYVQQTAVDDLFAAQSSELALKKSTNPQVRSFAKNVLKDHAAASQELKQTLQVARV